jgi:hypothetical protein
MAAAEVGLKGGDGGGRTEEEEGAAATGQVRFFYLYVASLVGLRRGRWVVGRLGQIHA